MSTNYVRNCEWSKYPPHNIDTHEYGLSSYVNSDQDQPMGLFCLNKVKELLRLQARKVLYVEGLSFVI